MVCQLWWSFSAKTVDSRRIWSFRYGSPIIIKVTATLLPPEGMIIKSVLYSFFFRRGGGADDGIPQQKKCCFPSTHGLKCLAPSYPQERESRNDDQITTVETIMSKNLCKFHFSSPHDQVWQGGYLFRGAPKPNMVQTVNLAIRNQPPGLVGWIHGDPSYDPLQKKYRYTVDIHIKT